MRSHDNEKVLGVVLNAKDGGERHIDPFKQFWIDRARKITERIEKRVSGEWEISLRINHMLVASWKSIENILLVAEAQWR